MAVTEATLREYLRLPPDSTENLSLFLEAAKAKSRAAGVKEFQNNKHYDLLIVSLAAMYYENRGFAFSGSYQATAEENARRMINAFVLELRYAEDGPVPDTSEGGDGE